jgi:hypothetical protein
MKCKSVEPSVMVLELRLSVVGQPVLGTFQMFGARFCEEQVALSFSHRACMETSPPFAACACCMIFLKVHNLRHQTHHHLLALLTEPCRLLPES